MKNIVFTLLLFISISVNSQEDIKLNTKDGVAVSYQLLLEEEGKKKDKYILIVNAINDTSEDIYYSVPLKKDANGAYALSPFGEEKGFTKIKVRNSTGLFGNGQSILGEQTEFITVDKHVLFVIKQQQTYSQETKFKVKTGVKPLITNTFSNVFKKLTDFNLEITKDVLNGNYSSSCGKFTFNLMAEENAEKGMFLTQTVNGNNFIWIRESDLVFKREDIEGYSIIYNKDKKSFKYSSSDGVKCVWSK